MQNIADSLGMQRQALYKWGRGETLPDVETVLLIHSQTGVSINWFLFEEGPMFVSHKPAVNTNGINFGRQLLADADHMIERNLLSAAVIILGELLELYLLSILGSDQVITSMEETAKRLYQAGTISAVAESSIRVCLVIREGALRDAELNLDSVLMMKDLIRKLPNRPVQLRARLM